MMLLIKISLLFSLLLPDSGKWQRIQTPECISFLFPNTPEKIVNTNNGIRSTIYQTKDLTCAQKLTEQSDQGKTHRKSKSHTNSIKNRFDWSILGCIAFCTAKNLSLIHI